MKRTIQTLLLLIFAIPCLNAQKKELSQARDFIKSGKSLDKAEQMMRTLLKDSANQNNKKIRLTLAESLRKQYEQGNEKLYLKQKYDTAALFTLTKKMFEAYEALDSIDALPDKKGKSKPEFRKKSAEFLLQLRPNLLNGGLYFVRKQDYASAYNLIEHYIDCVNLPLFSEESRGIDESREHTAAYWAVFCGYKLQDIAKVEKYADIALKDTSRLNYTYRYLAEMYEMSGDAAKSVEMLHKGFDLDKDTQYFFSHLIDYYNSTKQFDKAKKVIDDALKRDEKNDTYMYAKSNMMLNTGDYAGCIEICDKIIAQNDSLAEAYYNAGVAYMNIAFDLEKKNDNTRKGRELIKSYYSKARPYIEKYRELVPEEKDKWAAALYNIYLNLNMGREFEEIDKMLR